MWMGTWTWCAPDAGVTLSRRAVTEEGRSWAFLKKGEAQQTLLNLCEAFLSHGGPVLLPTEQDACLPFLATAPPSPPPVLPGPFPFHLPRGSTTEFFEVPIICHHHDPWGSSPAGESHESTFPFSLIQWFQTSPKEVLTCSRLFCFIGVNQELFCAL